MLVQVTAPHLCAGIVLEDDVCTDAAPILRWAVGRRRTELRQYFARKGWRVSIVTPTLSDTPRRLMSETGAELMRSIPDTPAASPAPGRSPLPSER